MTSQERKDLNRKAFLEGINKETAAEWENLAYRYERLGRGNDASYAREKAADIRARYPHFTATA